MNKLTKIGVSALCGSLAAIASANAGALSVSGGATATYSSVEKETTGNPLGMASAISFTGTGELDNGSTVTLALDQDDQSGYSAGSISIATPSMGTWTLDQGAGGSGLDRIDDMIPTAWEETNGTALGTGAQTVAGVGGSMNIEWNVSSDMLPDGMSLQVAHSPRAGNSGTNDKVQGGDNANGYGAGWDFVVQHSAIMDGLNIFAGYSSIEQNAATANGDRKGYSIGATYALGGATLGYQLTRDSHNLISSTSMYENTMYGVSFAVNDDLSISYGVMKSQKEIEDGVATTDVELEANSLQVAYSMGGASLKIAETSVDNGTYVSTTANDKDGTTIALSLAF